MAEAVPLYRKSFIYAAEHNEFREANLSLMANVACKDAIEAAIRDGYSMETYTLDPKGAEAVLAQFGAERLSYVLANTVQHKVWEARISTDNKAWAASIPVAGSEDGFLGTDETREFVVESHPGLLNAFVRAAREAMEKAEERRPSLRGYLEELRAEGGGAGRAMQRAAARSEARKDVR